MCTTTASGSSVCSSTSTVICRGTRGNRVRQLKCSPRSAGSAGCRSPNRCVGCRRQRSVLRHLLAVGRSSPTVPRSSRPTTGRPIIWTISSRLESGWRDAVRGDALLHLDVRSDNILIESTGRVVLVDWPHACIGAPWLDLLLMIPALVLEGGGEPEQLLEACGISADRNAIDSVVAAFAGLFVGARGQARPSRSAHGARVPEGAGRRDAALAAHEAG